MQSDDDAKRYTNSSKKHDVRKYVAGAVAAVLIFVLGLNMGNGTIHISSKIETANKGLPANLNYSDVDRVYDLLKANYDGKLDITKLQDGLKSGLAKATGDPYTQYFSKDEAKTFDEQLSGSFTGIGAELGQNDAGNLIIVTPISGFPADKAGLRAQDVIVSIDGKSTADMSIDEAVTHIRGPKDSKVTLRILRNKSEDLTLTITRDDIKIPSVKWEMDGTVGVITVSQFSEDTTDLMNRAASELKGKGAKSVLLDLRGNPGGLLTAAVDMSSLWLERGKTVLQEKRSGVTTGTYTSQASADGPVFKGMPTAVLIDAGSASAAEIVAGALHDNQVATLYGVKSFGKGSVQEIHKLPNGTEIKITVARWYRPNGQNIDKKGITPDHEVKMSEDDYKQNKDPQKDAALGFLRK